MRAKSLLSLCVCIAMLFPTIASAAEASQGSGGLSGTVAPKLTIFGYTGGGDATRAHYLQRYDYQKSWFGDNISGAYMDLDLDLAYTNGEGTSLSLERRGDGLTNHAGRVRFDTDKVGIAGYYNHHRTVAVGIDYITRPNNVPGGTDASYTGTGSGYVARFNDDTNGSFFRLDRTNYGAGVKLKPALLGEMAALSVNHDGYRRVGNTYATYVAGGSDFGANSQSVRWRGYDKPVNETMDRGSIGFAFSPKNNWFQFAYDGSFEKFVSRAQNFVMNDFASPVAASGFAVSAAAQQNPLHYIPDSTLTAHSVKVSKTFAKAALAAGYGMSVLGQDSFSYRQTSAFYNEGKIASQNFFVNGKVRVVPAVEAEAYLKYGNRRNDSTFPAAVTLLTPTVNEKLDMRLNTLKTVEYGVAATLRPTGSKSSLAAGWKRLTKKRGFSLNTSAAGAKAERMLYDTDSNTNEVYLKGAARPADGVTVSLRPSYEWADKVGSPIDAKKAVNLKAAASYATTEGSLLSVYYGYKDKRNGELDYTSGTTAAQTYSVAQNLRSILHSAGASLSAALTPKVNSSVSLDWTQNDFQSDYITSDIRRYTATAIAFKTRDRSSSKIDTYTLALANDWQAREALKLSGGYSFSRSKGNVATGLIATELESTVDGVVNNELHSVSLGADYAITKALNLVGQYVFDHYKDKQYASLSGSGHTLSTALAYRF